MTKKWSEPLHKLVSGLKYILAIGNFYLRSQMHNYAQQSDDTYAVTSVYDINWRRNIFLKSMQHEMVVTISNNFEIVQFKNRIV